MFTTLFSTTIIATSVVAAPKPPPPIHSAGSQDRQEEKKAEVAEVGEKAPAFALIDQHGKKHSLKDYKEKIIVLEWFNEQCPVCEGVWESGLIQKLVADLGELDAEVVYLAVNSTANRPEDDVLKTGAEYIEEAKINIPMLMDYDGKVGNAYGAKTTPHMYVINQEGVLVYQGALSDDRRGKEGKDAETHVMRAVKQVIAGDDVKPNYVQPWGCSVKYKRDNDGKDSERRRPRGPRRGPGR